MSQLLRQLFQHQQRCRISRFGASSHLRRSIVPSPSCTAQQQYRTYAARPRFGRRKKEAELDPDEATIWRQRLDNFPKEVTEEMHDYPMVTSKDLRSRVNRPRRVKMLASDFIEGEVL